MWRQDEKTETPTVRFCERCGQVCDAGCRRAALREHALLHQLWLGARG